MQSLLCKSTRSGYPAEYLVSRIHGRAQRPVSEESRGAGGEGTYLADDTVIWAAEARERYWLYLQMDAELRKTIAPVFLYLELNILVFCLRNLAAHQAENLAVNLEDSMLAKGLKKILLAKASLSEVVTNLERYLEGSPLNVNGLATAYKERGIQGCEEMLRNKFLTQVVAACGHREVAFFFRKIIDLKNTMTMAKCLRWQEGEIPTFIGGGTARLLKAEQVPTEASLTKMIWRCAGGLRVTGEDLDPVRLEPLLRAHLSRTMTRQMRSGDPVCICIGYIWDCFEAARKKSGQYQDGLFAENFPGTEERIL